jgi:hypothetical protein
LVNTWSTKSSPVVKLVKGEPSGLVSVSVRLTFGTATDSVTAWVCGFPAASVATMPKLCVPACELVGVKVTTPVVLLIVAPVGALFRV